MVDMHYLETCCRSLIHHKNQVEGSPVSENTYSIMQTKNNYNNYYYVRIHYGQNDLS